MLPRLLWATAKSGLSRIADSYAAAAIEPTVVRSAAHVTAVSPGILTELQARYPWLASDRVSAMPYGAEPDDLVQSELLGLLAPDFSPGDGTINICFTGAIQPKGGEMRAEIVVAGSPPSQFVLPPLTLMPVAAIDHLIHQLQANAASFPALMFDGEVIGDAFLIDVTEQDRTALRAARPADKPVAMPTAKSWPVFMTFTRGRQQDQRPLFTVSALVFNNGVLDRLTVETGLLSVTADLQALEMRTAPVCPRS